jgi:hypothetical protein
LLFPNWAYGPFALQNTVHRSLEGYILTLAFGSEDRKEMGYLMSDRDRALIAYALRVFIRNYDGQPASPVTPSQTEVDHAKRILQEL